MPRIPTLSRRYLTFSLRTLFVLLTALAVWLGVVVNRAREQRETVEAIEALGGRIIYDWEKHPLDPFGPDGEQPPGPVCVRRLVGDDLFQRAIGVAFYADSSDSHLLAAIPDLKRLPHLKAVVFWVNVSENTQNELQVALPNCRLLVDNKRDFQNGF